jgi:plasmid stabilization system protein ParE
MAEVVWAIPALNDLEGILEYIELDNADAANNLAKEIFKTTDQLSEFPESGSKPRELKGTPYKRQIVGPIKIYHRYDGTSVYIVHASRAERNFKLSRLIQGDKG